MKNGSMTFDLEIQIDCIYHKGFRSTTIIRKNQNYFSLCIDNAGSRVSEDK